MNLAWIINLFYIYKYPVIFLIAIFEGPIIMMLSGTMLRLGVVGFWSIYATLIAGDLVGDTFYYLLGYNFANPFVEKCGKFFDLTPEKIERTKSTFKNHEKKIIFLSKITMGFGFAVLVLMTAGATKMSFRKFISINFLGQFIWTSILLSVGYFFGDLYKMIDKDLQFVSIVAFVVITFLLLRGINARLRKNSPLIN